MDTNLGRKLEETSIPYLPIRVMVAKIPTTFKIHFDQFMKGLM